MSANQTPTERFAHLDAVMHGEVVDEYASAMLAKNEKVLIEDDKRAADLLLEIGTRIEADLGDWTMNTVAELTMASLAIVTILQTAPEENPTSLYRLAADNVNRRVAA